MAKKSGLPVEKKSSKSYPSVYGSHASMINTEATEVLSSETQLTQVVLTDDMGDYQTDRFRLDSGLADPNRYKENRLAKLFAKTTDKE